MVSGRMKTDKYQIHYILNLFKIKNQLIAHCSSLSFNYYRYDYYYYNLNKLYFIMLN